MIEQHIADVEFYEDMQRQYELYCQKPFRGMTAVEMYDFIEENVDEIKKEPLVKQVGFQIHETLENWEWAVAVWTVIPLSPAQKVIIENIIGDRQPFIFKSSEVWSHA